MLYSCRKTDFFVHRKIIFILILGGMFTIDSMDAAAASTIQQEDDIFS